MTAKNYDDQYQRSLASLVEVLRAAQFNPVHRHLQDRLEDAKVRLIREANAENMLRLQGECSALMFLLGELFPTDQA